MASDKDRDHDLRGLAYFGTVKEVSEWKATSVDPLSVSNTPFLKRSYGPYIPASNPKGTSANLLLLDDCGYRGYDRCQGAVVDSEVYICEQWQRVEAFNYFSHNRVGIPPTAWINAGHRNGALVLGTIICDGNDKQEAKDLLQIKDGKYTIASILAQMAAVYGFDGWFINIECKFASSTEEWKSGSSLKLFLDQLRKDLKNLPSGGKVIWYDAVTKDNVFPGYRYTLNDDNAIFAASAGSLMTDYKWTVERHVDPAVKFAENTETNLDSVYFGIECWTQSGVNSGYGIEHAYQREPGTVGKGTGYGGTATGLAVKPLAKRGLGAAIFSAHWAYPHFYRAGHEGEGDMYSRAVDRFMWEGTPDIDKLDGLTCSCGVGTHRRPDFKDNPIVKFAKQYPAGSDGFFYTDYTEPVSYIGPKQFRADIGQQSILPAPNERSATLNSTIDDKTVGNLSAVFKNGQSKCAIELSRATAVSSISGETLEGSLTIHKTSARGDLDLDLIIIYQKLAAISGLEIRLFAVCGGTTRSKVLLADPQKRNFQVLQIRNTQDRITALGISVSCPAQALANLSTGGTLAVLDIFSLTLKPTKESYPAGDINEIKLVQRGGQVAKTAHYRLAWSIPNTTSSSTYLPWSPITGPFSHFYVSADKIWLPSRAYAKEYMLDQSLFQVWKNAGKTKVTFEIWGYAFDGNRIATKSAEVVLPA